MPTRRRVDQLHHGAGHYGDCDIPRSVLSLIARILWVPCRFPAESAAADIQIHFSISRMHGVIRSTRHRTHHGVDWLVPPVKTDRCPRRPKRRSCKSPAHPAQFSMWALHFPCALKTREFCHPKCNQCRRSPSSNSREGVFCKGRPERL